MSAPKVAAYGTWTSPITSDITSSGAVAFKEVHVNPQSSDIYLVEARPAEKGRGAIVRMQGTESIDILPKEYSTKGKIHEYGGGAIGMCPDGTIIFNDANTDGVFTLSNSGEVTEILKGNAKLRFADFDVSIAQPDWVLAVHEIHQDDGEVLNTIAAINLKTKTSKVVVEGADFYSHPRFGPDGKKISWMQWNHPDMPWTGSEVYVADWENGEVTGKTYVAGKALDNAVCQPRWHFDGTLWFIQEPEGIWQLYRYYPDTKKVEFVHLKGYENIEMGMREVKIGNCSYVPLDQNTIVIAYTKEGTSGLITYNLTTKDITELDLEIVEVAFTGVRRTSSNSFALIGATTKTPQALYHVSLSKPNEKQLLKSTTSIPLPLSIFSPSKSITFPRTHGVDRSLSSHAIYAPPHNPDFIAPDGTLPPMIVSIHGGPTSHVPPGLELDAQYFTSRGYAYVSVNYSGSTGYGRAYRMDLNYNWGIKDVEDTLSCIDYLADNKLIDRARVGIRGGSAGGYTVLQAMVVHPTVFAAGCSLYGVGNLKKLAEFTHKFESHYLFNLLFPSDTPLVEQEKIYHDRSPCFHAERIERPLVLLQGSVDKVVPIDQATEMERVLREGGKDVKLVVFEGEGHGWARGDSLKRSIEEEEGLWKRCLLA
ncbi:Alpha/Beta hydrolase protein [Halenospora varia]|nr:Alpha/Beta hydrolase protein [Halenospora varia]